jgi:hypothetical protein
MYDPSRLKGMGVAIASVTLALAGFSLLAQAVAGGRPAWLAGGDSTIEGGQDRIVGGRIKAVALQARSSKDAGLDDLGVILGASAVGMDLDTARLMAAADAKIPRHWLSLSANGANAEDLHDLAGLLFTSGLRPKLLVLGIHPGTLARSDEYLTDRMTLDAEGFRKELADKHLIQAKEEFEALSVVPVNLAFPNRTRVSNRIRGLASTAKRRMFAALKMGVEALYPAEKDPWGVRLLIEDAEEPGREADAEGRKATVRDQAEGPMRAGLAGPVNDKGWLTPGAYSSEGVNARALVDLIKEARASGTEVVVLLMPEASDLRDSIPPEAIRCLRESFDRGFGPASPPVIDLRACLADDQFHGTIHATKSGREAATARLIEALRARALPEKAQADGR